MSLVLLVAVAAVSYLNCYGCYYCTRRSWRISKFCSYLQCQISETKCQNRDYDV